MKQIDLWMDCLITVKKYKYAFLWLSSLDIYCTNTDEAWVTETWKYVPFFLFCKCPLLLEEYIKCFWNAISRVDCLSNALLYFSLFATDINECDLAADTHCPPANHVYCQNSLGGYYCVCTNNSYRQLQTERCVSEYDFLLFESNFYFLCQNVHPGVRKIVFC